MKKIVLALLIFCSLSAFAQDTEKPAETLKWTKGGMFTFQFNQVSLTNWAAGGQSSLSINTMLNVFANYKDDKQTWSNSLDIGYGLLKQGSAPLIKSDDRIELNSKYGRNINDAWFYSALLNFKTQMADGFNYPNDSKRISKFLAPGYMILALGFDYNPSESFTYLLSPITSKVTIVNDQTLADAGAFGVYAAEVDGAGVVTANGRKIRYEVGAYLKMMYKKDIMENVNFQTKLDLFSNYLNNPQNIDVNWEILVGMKINKYLTATLNTHLIYDDDIVIDNNNDGIADVVGPRTQFKEVFGLGLSLKF